MKHPVPIFLNKEAKWILEAWHVKLALRRIGIIAKNECIVLPEKKIAGPDSHVENKDFIVKIIVSKFLSYNGFKTYKFNNYLSSATTLFKF